MKKEKIFENKINNLVEKSFLNYQNYYKKYIIENNNVEELNHVSIKSIITERVDYFFISEEEYPFLKYFTFSNYPIKEQFVINFE